MYVNDMLPTTAQLLPSICSGIESVIRKERKKKQGDLA